MVKLEKQIKSLEIDINKHEDYGKQKQLLVLRAQYNKLTSDKAAKSLLWLNQAFYDQGEKAGKLLAWRIKKIESERAINGITTQSGGSRMIHKILIMHSKTFINHCIDQNLLSTLLIEMLFLTIFNFKYSLRRSGRNWIMI